MVPIEDSKSDFDYIGIGQASSNHFAGTVKNDLIHAGKEGDKIYLSQGFDTIYTGKGKDRIYLTNDNLTDIQSYTIIEDFDVRRDKLELATDDDIIDALQITNLGNCTAISIHERPSAIFSNIEFDEFLAADIPEFLI